jgi:chromate transport protein ChrA
LGVGSVVDDTDELIQIITEKELVQKNLLGSFSPLILAICKNEGNKFQNHLVRSSAVIALCKFMCVSVEFWYVSFIIIILFLASIILFLHHNRLTSFV